MDLPRGDADVAQMGLTPTRLATPRTRSAQRRLGRLGSCVGLQQQEVMIMFWFWFDELCMFIGEEANNLTIDIWAESTKTIEQLMQYCD